MPSTSSSGSKPLDPPRDAGTRSPGPVFRGCALSGQSQRAGLPTPPQDNSSGSPEEILSEARSAVNIYCASFMNDHYHPEDASYLRDVRAQLQRLLEGPARDEDLDEQQAAEAKTLLEELESRIAKMRPKELAAARAAEAIRERRAKGAQDSWRFRSVCGGPAGPWEQKVKTMVLACGFLTNIYCCAPGNGNGAQFACAGGCAICARDGFCSAKACQDICCCGLVAGKCCAAGAAGGAAVWGGAVAADKIENACADCDRQHSEQSWRNLTAEGRAKVLKRIWGVDEHELKIGPEDGH